MRYLSLFSGMEAATIAWSPLGWECVGVSEIDPAACAVLRHRLPGAPNLGSVTEINDEDIAALGPIDVVIGGSPCQDLSVAGKRAGLAGERSSLFHEQLRIFNAARTLCGARWLIWENVPGAFSSNKGRDFAVVVGAMAGCELPVPADGWGSEGVSLGDAGFVEWAVLDSQWFGVAQRRRRVFAVLDTGDWANRPPVLLEPDSLRGDSAPSREAGERVAPTLDVRAGRSGETSFHTSGGLVPEVSPAVTSKWAKGTGGPAGDECQNLVPVAFGGQMSVPQVDFDLSQTLQAKNPQAVATFDVAHTLRGEGFDASEDGTGRGTPLVPAMAVALRGREGGATIELGGEIGHALRASQGGGDKPHVFTGMAVRRLTPRECERLQAAPDGWTLVPNAKGKPMADGPRYKMLGNSFTATVIRWIGRRIEAAVAYSEDRREAE